MIKKKIVKTTNKRKKIDKSKIEDSFDDIEIKRFRTTENGYKDFAIQAIKGKYEHVARYTGKNNVNYSKKCIPKKSDIQIKSIEPVYLPEFLNIVDIQDYNYKYELIQTKRKTSPYSNELNECVHCSRDDDKLTFCKGCGSINCKLHTKTERLEQEPICTECAVTKKFFFKTKYFYNKDNLKDFERIYSEMPIYKKPFENKSLAYSTAVLLTISMILILGMI